MDINDYIKVFDEALSPYIAANFIKFAQKMELQPQPIGADAKNPQGYVNKKIRNVSGYTMWNYHKSITEAHWFNLFSFALRELRDKYEPSFASKPHTTKINDITLLKYEEGQYYKVHSDSSTQNPRVLSFIWFLNNDYEGGELNFHCPKTFEILKTIKPGVNKVVVFPSNFMFPHSISEIKKGTRYSLVSWMS